ncbi:MAG: phage replication protein, partial [Coprothermobacterota bacterium]|nr:phage replication protein [Coprothermobacterota bacterium]
MRARNLKPGFFHNEQLLSLSPLHRILFTGLWCLADWKGRLEDRPGKIKIEVLPGDPCDINQLLDDLAAADHLILRYQVEGRRLIQVATFEKHQHVSEKEKR